jgi:hypothetical protein
MIQGGRMSIPATTSQSTTADRPFSVDRSLLIRRLREVLPAQALLFEEEDLRPYDCDGLTAYRQLPLLVAAGGRSAGAGDSPDLS